MKTYLRCLAAYLTGWLIVQPLYNRLHAAWRRQEMAKPNGEYRVHLRETARETARAIVDELETRSESPLSKLFRRHDTTAGPAHSISSRG